MSSRPFHFVVPSPLNQWARPVIVLFMAITLAFASLASTMASTRPQDESDIPDRPPTEKLLPETTVLFVQVDNFRDMVEKLQESAGGQLWNDESVKPLVDGIWEEAKNTYDEQAKGEVGLDLDDLIGLPEGELTFAVIAPRRKNPEFFMLLELNEEDGRLDRVLDRGREVLSEEQDLEEELTEDGFKLESFKIDGDKTVTFFRHENLMVGCTSEEELNALIDRWMGREVEKVRPLSSNRKFVTIMNRCLGTKDLQPEARFFVDPIGLWKSSTRGDIASQAAINFLPLLGLDGLLGIGGSMILSEEEFDSVVHGHILLSNPKGGVFEMMAFKPTDYEPDAWIPDNVNNYMTTSWDFEKMLAELTTMIESVQGEGVVDEFIENRINSELELDFREDILKQVQGTVTITQWLEPPARINSNVVAIGLKMRDPEKGREIIQAFVDRINRFEGNRRDPDEGERDANLVAREYRGFEIWGEPDSRVERRRARMQEFRNRNRGDDEGFDPRVDLDIAQPQPSFAIVGDTLILSPQSRGFIERAIDSELGSAPSLRDDEGFQEIQDRMRKLLKGELPCMVFFQNPSETIKMMMEVAEADNTKAFLQQVAEENETFSRFKRRLDDNPLPEFDALKKYFTKSGGFATSDDTGYHFLLFNLKPDIE